MGTLKNIYTNILYGLGILSRRYAFTGPYMLDMAISNSCNLNCMGCVYHSHRADGKYSAQWKSYHMAPEVFYRLIDEAKHLQVREIFLGDSGEPLLHPELFQFIAYSKKNGFRCTVLTNGTLLNAKKLETFSSLCLDRLIISIWDQDQTRYGMLRPGYEGLYSNLIETLHYYKQYKQKIFSHIRLLFVLTKHNAGALEEMCRLAEAYAISDIRFYLFEATKRTYQDMMIT